MKRFLLVLLMATPMLAQQTQAQFTFKYNNPRLSPASYTLVVHEDGEGHFHSEPGTVTDYNQIQLPALDRDVKLSSALTSQIFSTARQQHFFAISCEDGKGKIAFQGTKTLLYEGRDGHGSCEFNWSKTIPIQKLAEQLIAVANTLTIGNRLESEHEHDRLGLDAELESLSRQLGNGQAAEISNISKTLEAIVNDEAVMARARRRAKALLEDEKTAAK